MVHMRPGTRIKFWSPLILPFCVFYAISMNSPLSRPCITAYTMLLGCSAIFGEGLLGGLHPDIVARASVGIPVMLVVMGWLYGSPKMRFYYSTLRGRPVPARDRFVVKRSLPLYT